MSILSRCQSRIASGPWFLVLASHWLISTCPVENSLSSSSLPGADVLSLASYSCCWVPTTFCWIFLLASTCLVKLWPFVWHWTSADPWPTEAHLGVLVSTNLPISGWPPLQQHNQTWATFLACHCQSPLQATVISRLDNRNGLQSCLTLFLLQSIIKNWAFWSAIWLWNSPSASLHCPLAWLLKAFVNWCLLNPLASSLSSLLSIHYEPVMLTLVTVSECF